MQAGWLQSDLRAPQTDYRKVLRLPASALLNASTDGTCGALPAAVRLPLHGSYVSSSIRLLLPATVCRPAGPIAPCLPTGPHWFFSAEDVLSVAAVRSLPLLAWLPARPAWSVLSLSHKPGQQSQKRWLAVLGLYGIHVKRAGFRYVTSPLFARPLTSSSQSSKRKPTTMGTRAKNLATKATRKALTMFRSKSPKKFAIWFLAIAFVQFTVSQSERVSEEVSLEPSDDPDARNSNNQVRAAILFLAILPPFPAIVA